MRTSDWSADLGASDRTADIESRLCCTRHARDATNAIAFPTAALDHPVASANKLLFRLLGGYLDRVRASARTTIVDRVEDYVRGSLPSGHCSIEMFAKTMGTSVRTLQANLSSHGLKFSERKSVVEGKSFSVRVALCGRRIHKKK